jgi:hypothetical protein
MLNPPFRNQGFQKAVKKNASLIGSDKKQKLAHPGAKPLARPAKLMQLSEQSANIETKEQYTPHESFLLISEEKKSEQIR